MYAHTDNITSKTPYGTVDYDGVTLNLICDAYADNLGQYLYYTAFAVDEQDNEYKIEWEVTNHECTEEDHHCDWSYCTVEKL